MSVRKSPRPWRDRRLVLFTALAVAVGWLSWPSATSDLPPSSNPTAFRWDADQLFSALESEFVRAGAIGAEAALAAAEALDGDGRALLDGISVSDDLPADALRRLTTLQFEMAVLGAAHPSLLPRVQDFFVDTRVTLMKAAASWPMDRASHEAIYRVVFGGRIALDEALVQANPDALSPLLVVEDIPSATPSVLIEGVRIHSGDILLSRGGAPTSALIARGNDFPNTFSHSALAHVDPTTGEATVIESLIETGSVLTSVADYLQRTTHRILVLRLSPEHPALIADPLLPHRAADALLASLREDHIPYDFEMDWEDSSAAFCSEIIFHAYRDQDVELWTLRSSMTTPGLVRWLSSMGVRQFTSLVPSDLEYDPQVRAVVEWRNAPALMDFRFDNAIIDVLLEEADRGYDLGYGGYALPAARLLKAFSVAQSTIGATPRIPSGMSASTALRVDALVSRVQPALKAELLTRAEAFRERNGYEAPYWVLVELVRESLHAMRESLEPALAPA